MTTLMNAEALAVRHAGDLELVRGVLRRRRHAISLFVRRMTCVPRILRAQNRRIGNPLSPEDLLDLAQDVILIVWRKLDLFEGRSSLETWVFRICRLELLNVTRRSRRFSRSIVDVTPDQPVEEEGEDVARVDADVAYHALMEIGPPPSEIILMKHYEDMTFHEIGRRLGMSPNTTKSHYYRGLTRLRETLGLDTESAA